MKQKTETSSKKTKTAARTPARKTSASKGTQPAAIAEDELIQSLLEARKKRVEVIAFGVCYTGLLQMVDVNNGIIVVVDGDDQVMLEIERIESFAQVST